jgi:hypothetical protein
VIELVRQEKRRSGGDLWSDGRVCFMNPSERLPKPYPLLRAHMNRGKVGELANRGRDEAEDVRVLSSAFKPSAPVVRRSCRGSREAKALRNDCRLRATVLCEVGAYERLS